MNPFYYSPTDPRGPWIYVPGWPDYKPFPGKELKKFNYEKSKALAAGIEVRPEDIGLVKRKAFCSTLYWPLPDMDEQDAEIEAWQPAPNTVYWLSVEVEIFEQYIEPPDTIHCNRGGDRKYVRILPNKEEPKPEGTDSALSEARNYLIAEGLDPDEIARDGVSFVHNLIKKIKMEKKQSGEEKREYCDQCDGVGWYEGGGPKIQTTCEACNGTGFKPEEKKEYEKPDNEKTLATIWFDVANGSWHKIHEAVKNDPIAYFASIEDLLKYDHFYRNGLADRLNQDSAEYLSMKEMCDYYKDRADKAEKILREAHTISFRGKSSEESNERRKEINKELLNQMELEAEEVNKKEILEFLRIYEDNRDSGRNYSTMVQTLSDLFSLSRKKQ